MTSELKELTPEQSKEVLSILDRLVEPAIGTALAEMTRRITDLAAQKKQTEREARQMRQMVAASLLSVALTNAGKTFSPDELRALARSMIAEIAESKGML